jgi:hypothetical protein
VDILAMINWLINNPSITGDPTLTNNQPGTLAADPALTAIYFGIKYNATGGQPATFQVNSFSITGQ